MHDKRGKKNLSGNASSSAAEDQAAITSGDPDGDDIPVEPELSDFEGSDIGDSIEPRSAKRPRTDVSQTPMAKQRPPPTSTPDKLAIVQAALAGAETVPSEARAGAGAPAKLGVS